MRRLLLLSLVISLFAVGDATAASGSKSPVRLALEANMELITENTEVMGKFAGGSFSKQAVHVSLAALVYSVAFSPNGRYVASGLDDNAIMIWDLSVGRAVHNLTGHEGWVMSLAFSQDNNRLVSGGSDGKIIIWNVSKGNSVSTYNTFSKTVSTVAFSADQRFILAGNENQQIMILDATTGGFIRSFKTGEEMSSSKIVPPYAFSNDGRYALSTNERSAVILWEISSGKDLKSFSGHSGDVTALAFSPDGSIALVGTSSGGLVVFDVASGKAVKKLKGHDSLVRSVVFSKDGRYALSGSHDNTARLWDVSTGNEVTAITESPKQIKTVALSPDQRLILTGSIDGTTRIWDRKTSQEIVTMAKLVKYLPPMYAKTDIPAREEDFKPISDAWVVLTPDGYYTGSANALGNISVVRGIRIYKIDRFYDVFYRPDIIIARLRGEDTRDIATITMDDALKNPPPDVDISSVPDSTDKEIVRIRYEVVSDGGGIGEIRVFHNGKLIHSDGYYRSYVKKSQDKIALASVNGAAVYQSMRSVVIKEKTTTSPIVSKAKGDSYKGEVIVEAIPGDNEVSIAAFNKDNTVQSKIATVTFKSTLAPRAPHLYILSVGIDDYRDKSINLSFAAKDARDVTNKLIQQSTGIYKKENIHPLILIDKDASKKNILGKIEEIAGRVKPTDGLIIFVAGHGILHQNQYYLITHDYNGDVGEDVMIGSNEIMEMSKKIKSLNQLFVFDTCHAGGVDWIVSGLYDARISALAKQMGLHIYASASSMQEAKDGYKGNGLFTHTLLNGLSNNRGADKNKDRKVSVEELGDFTRIETTEISRQTGHAQIPFIINFGHDHPVYELH